MSPVGDINLGPQQGWQCPCCGRVYSPSTIMCFYCGGQSPVTPQPYTPSPEPYKTWAGTPPERDTSTSPNPMGRVYQTLEWKFDEEWRPSSLKVGPIEGSEK